MKNFKKAMLLLTILGTILLPKSNFTQSAKNIAINQARINENEAIKIANKEYKNYIFLITDLDHEHGQLVYELKGSNNKNSVVELDINANTGTILKKKIKTISKHLINEAKIPMKDVLDIVKNENPEYTFIITDIDKENGYLIYEVYGATSNNTNTVEIEVDAITGDILKTEHKNI